MVTKLYSQHGVGKVDTGHDNGLKWFTVQLGGTLCRMKGILFNIQVLAYCNSLCSQGEEFKVQFKSGK